MRTELLDVIRRHCLADVADALGSIELDDEARASVLDALTEAFDAILLAVERETLPSAVKGTVAQFAFLRIWPRVLARLAPAIVMVETQREDFARKATAAIEARMMLTYDREPASPTESRR